MIITKKKLKLNTSNKHYDFIAMQRSSNKNETRNKT